MDDDNYNNSGGEAEGEDEEIIEESDYGGETPSDEEAGSENPDDMED